MSAAVRALEAALGGHTDEAVVILDEANRGHVSTPGDRARRAAVAGFVALIDGRSSDAVTLVDAALELTESDTDPGARAVAASVAGFVHCYATEDRDDPAAAVAMARIGMLRERILSLGGDDGIVAGYLAIESAMAAGQLRLAQEFGESYAGRSVPLHTGAFAQIALARSYAFQGMLAQAQATAELATAAAVGVPARVLVAAVSAYLAAQAERREETERLTAIVEQNADRGTIYTIGAHVLCAFALAAVESVGRAATMILWAGGGAALSRLQVVDRAYGYELLAADAIERGDLSSARAWGRRALPLGGNDMAVAAVERTLSRIDAAVGSADSAAEHAVVAAARALLAGGRLDAVRSGVLLAAAHAVGGSTDRAVAELRHASLEAHSIGAVAVHRWSSRELSRLGREPAGGGFLALSAREQQVALLAAEGFSNRAIGQALFLSERTVQGYLSRALAALGVSSRSGIPASLGRAPGEAESLDALTPRQHQVALLIAAGHTNRAISERLGISDKTVEKHIVAIFTRLRVSSRTGIANRVLSRRPEALPA